MNKVYRLVWNRALGSLQIASELTSKSHGRGVGEVGFGSRLTVHALATAIGIILASTPIQVFAQSCVETTGAIDASCTGTTSNNGGTGQKGDGGSPSAMGSGSGGTGRTGGAGGGSAGAGGAGFTYSTPSFFGGSGGGGGVYGGGGSSGGGDVGRVTETGAGGGGGNPGVITTGDLSIGSGATVTGGAGADGGSAHAYGGGGGGGAAAVSIGGAGSVFSSSGQIVGGTGGTGGAGYLSGGGGGGGMGLAIGTDDNTGDNSGSITGGSGGGAGSLDLTSFSGAGGGIGAGGNGGAGVGITGSSNKLVNTGSITGGAGANGALDGIGGAGVSATGGGNMLTNAGLIAGGLSGDGTTQANAVEFSGGMNVLLIEAGGSFQGNVVSTSGTANGGDALGLGGDTNASGGNFFDLSQIVDVAPSSSGGPTQFYGFSQYGKVGDSTWTVTGMSDLHTAWLLVGGTLQVGDDANTASITGDLGNYGVYAASGTTLGVAAGSGVYGGEGTAGMDMSSGNVSDGGAGGPGVYGSQATVDNDGVIGGGAGGTGGRNDVDSQGTGVAGGIGGAGGDGINGKVLTVNNTGAIYGGAGGQGGSGGYVIANFGGLGGDGGAGIRSSGASMLSNSGSVSGGAGGIGGVSGYGADAGAGGMGLTGDGFALDNAASGVVTGGAGGYASSRSYLAGNAGDGGAGISGTGFDVTNAGAVQGGAGGFGVQAFASVGAAGMGGAGVTGTDFTLANSGTVVGGDAGSFCTTGCSYGGPGYKQPSVASIGADGGAGVSGSSMTITNSGSVAGGSGGTGGPGGSGVSYSGGDSGGPTYAGPGAGGIGGQGGAGVAGSGMALSNTGTIRGGVGGVGGVGGYGPAAGSTDGSTEVAGPGGFGGAGGVGVVSTGGSTVRNAGLIAGGISGMNGLVGTPGSDGGPSQPNVVLNAVSTSQASSSIAIQADAVNFSGGGNTLVLEAGGSFVGNVISTSGDTHGGDTFSLGGDVNAPGGNVFSLSSLAQSAPDSYNGTASIFGFTQYSKSGTSSWALTGTDVAGVDWTIADGNLIGDSASFGGNLTFAPAAGGAPVVTFAQDTDGEYDGVISGAGQLTKQGAGVLVLGGENTYSGGTTIEAGTLQVGNGGTSGSIVGAVTNNGTLAFDRSDDITVTSVISGSGALEQRGSGSLILTGASSYTGDTTVSAGTFEIGDAAHPMASVGGNVMVTAGGTLRGHGSVGGNVSNVGGTVMPGGSTGIFTVAGNYVQDANGTLALEISPDPTPGTGSSQLRVGGTASIDGTLAVMVDPGTYLSSSSYDLVHAAGGISGTFAATMYNPAFAAYLTPKVTVSANDVTLAFEPTAQAFSSALPNYASTVSLGMEQSFDAVLGRPQSIGEGRVGAWGQYMGGSGGMGASSRYAMHGGAAGVGVAVSDGLVLGAAVSGGTTTTSVASSQVRAKPLGGFIYGIWRQGDLRLAGSFGAGQLTQHSRRYLGGADMVQEASSDGRYNGFALRGDYAFHLGVATLSPFAGYDQVNGRYDPAQEGGMPLLALNYGKVSQHLSHYQAGLRVGLSGGNWQPWVQVGAEGWGNDRAISVTETLGDFRQVVSSSPLPSSALSAGAGVNWHSGQWDTTLSWHGAWGSNYHGNSGMLQVGYHW